MDLLGTVTSCHVCADLQPLASSRPQRLPGAGQSPGQADARQDDGKPTKDAAAGGLGQAPGGPLRALRRRGAGHPRHPRPDRVLHRVTNSRITPLHGDTMTFHDKKRATTKNGSRQKALYRRRKRGPCTIAGQAFPRRFCQPIPPKGLHEPGTNRYPSFQPRPTSAVATAHDAP